jgi:hypothetical protein
MENEWYRVQLKSFELEVKHQKILKSSAKLHCSFEVCKPSTLQQRKSNFNELDKNVNGLISKHFGRMDHHQAICALLLNCRVKRIHVYNERSNTFLYLVITFSFILIRVWSQWLLTGSRTRKEIHGNVSIYSLFYRECEIRFTIIATDQMFVSGF